MILALFSILPSPSDALCSLFLLSTRDSILFGAFKFCSTSRVESLFYSRRLDNQGPRGLDLYQDSPDCVSGQHQTRFCSGLDFMMSTFRRAFLLAIILLAPEVLGLQVTPNSPCASTCMDDVSDNVSDPNSSNTVPSDIVCADADYTNVAAGRKYEACVNCLRNSTASSDGEDDQSWFLCEFALRNHFQPDPDHFLQTTYDTPWIRVFSDSRILPTLNPHHAVPRALAGLSNRLSKTEICPQVTKVHTDTAQQITMRFLGHL